MSQSTRDSSTVLSAPESSIGGNFTDVSSVQPSTATKTSASLEASVTPSDVHEQSLASGTASLQSALRSLTAKLSAASGKRGFHPDRRRNARSLLAAYRQHVLETDESFASQRKTDRRGKDIYPTGLDTSGFTDKDWSALDSVRSLVEQTPSQSNNGTANMSVFSKEGGREFVSRYQSEFWGEDTSALPASSLDWRKKNGAVTMGTREDGTEFVESEMSRAELREVKKAKLAEKRARYRAKQSTMTGTRTRDSTARSNDDTQTSLEGFGEDQSTKTRRSRYTLDSLPSSLPPSESYAASLAPSTTISVF